MKERVRLEKAKKNTCSAKEVENSKDPSAQQKRRHPGDVTDGQKKKKKTQKQTEGDKEKEKKAKEREEKRKKKDEEEARQKLILEARKAQAASRWATNNQAESEVAIFTPEPVRRQSSIQLTPPAQLTLHVTDGSQNTVSQTSNTLNQTSPPSRCQSSKQLTTPAHSTFPTSDKDQNANIRQCAPQTTAKTPLQPSKSNRTSQPKRGLHFQSAVGDSSDDEICVEGEDIPEQSDISDSPNCCNERRLEIEALRKRLDKVHKRLNIARKFLSIVDFTPVYCGM